MSIQPCKRLMLIWKLIPGLGVSADVVKRSWGVAEGLIRQLVYYKRLHSGLWALFDIRSVFEFKHASVRRHLLALRSPLAPRFNLISPASTATFGF